MKKIDIYRKNPQNTNTQEFQYLCSTTQHKTLTSALESIDAPMYTKRCRSGMLGYSSFFQYLAVIDRKANK